MPSLSRSLAVSAFVLALAQLACATKKVGDPCETYQSSDCGGNGGTCMTARPTSYCTVSCEAEKDCPSGWKCEGITQTTINGKGEKKGVKTVQLCVKS